MIGIAVDIVVEPIREIEKMAESGATLLKYVIEI
jgi:hypothetical protein